MRKGNLITNPKPLHFYLFCNFQATELGIKHLSSPAASLEGGIRVKHEQKWQAGAKCQNEAGVINSSAQVRKPGNYFLEVMKHIFL